MKELKARMEDALYATRASVSEGVVPGGGTALIRAASFVEGLIEQPDDPDLEGLLPKTEDEWHGFRLVLKACSEPCRQIMRNAGASGSVMVHKVKDLLLKGEMWGVDATDLQEKDLVLAGILDPTKVVRSALQNAVSIAGTMLTTECAIRKPDVAKSADMDLG
jgi:chaperonin GroEL